MSTLPPALADAIAAAEAREAERRRQREETARLLAEAKRQAELSQRREECRIFTEEFVKYFGEEMLSYGFTVSHRPPGEVFLNLGRAEDPVAILSLGELGDIWVIWGWVPGGVASGWRIGMRGKKLGETYFLNGSHLGQHSQEEYADALLLYVKRVIEMVAGQGESEVEDVSDDEEAQP